MKTVDQMFEIAGGSVPGSEHTKPGRPGWVNNQDAFVWRMSPEVMIGVVCDGCGSSKHSEVGAKIGANIVANCLFHGYESYVKNPELFIRLLELNITGQLRQVASFMREPGKDPRSLIPLVHEYFLFTTLFFFITAEKAVIYAMGDGIFSMNSETRTLGPYPGNQPPYIGYRIADHRYKVYDGPFEFTLMAECETKDLQTILIGTDGLEYFIQNEQTIIPKTKEPLGPLSQFWTDSRYFLNNDMIRRTLAVANHDHVIDGRIRIGPLHDDTTLIVVRKKKERPLL